MPRRPALASLSPGMRRAAEAYRARLEGYAWRMRFHPSPAEAMLWSALRGSQLGVAFRRQMVLGEPARKLYIVDFYAPSVRLVVEVDEAHHAQRAAQDARRDAALGRLGYRVVRTPAQVVLQELPVALEMVREALRHRKRVSLA